MNPKPSLVFAAALALMAGGCASSGGTDTTASAPVTVGGRELPEGTPPRDNVYTRSASLYLVQAQRNPNEAERRQRYEEALEASINGIANEPENPRSYMQAGQAYLGLGDLVGADSMLTKAEEIYPRYILETEPIREQEWVQNYNRAINQLSSGSVREAVNLFERANLIYRGRPEAMLNLGSAYSRLGETESSIEAYEQALEVMRSDAFEDQDPETQEVWRENEEIAAFNVAQLLAQAGRYEEAADRYRTYLERDPDNVMALSNLAVVLVSMDQRDSALALYDRLLARTDLTARDYFSAGVGLFQVEAYDRAADAFRAAVRLNPVMRDAAYNLAQTLFLSEQYEDLEAAATRLIELDSHNSNAYRFLAQAHVQAGDDQEAVRVLERMEALPFEVANTQLQPQAGGGAILQGDVENRTLEAGTPITLRILFSGPEGEDVGAVDVQVQAPAPEASVAFQAELESDQPVMGYRYEVVSP